MANTLTLTPDAVADIVATFIVSDDTLTSRVAMVGALATEHKVSGNAIYDTLVAPYDVRPVGLSLATVQNALAAYTLASLHLGPDVRASYYAEILTGIHAVRVKPLREMWGKLITDRGATADADRGALISEAIAAVVDAREVPTVEESPAESEPESPAESEPEEVAPAAEVRSPRERAMDALIAAASALAAIDSADDATAIAATATELAALATARAAELTPATATPATARKRTPKVSA